MIKVNKINILSMCVLCFVKLAACREDEPPTEQMRPDMAAEEMGHDAAPDAAPALDMPADLAPEPDADLDDMAPELDAAPDLSEDQGMLDMDAPPDPALEPLRQAILSDIARNNATGASVAIWRGDQIVWVGGFGTIDPDDPARVPDADTQFMIGSDTKKIASIAYLQQVEAQRATEATTIAEVLPGLSLPRAPRFTEATAAQLMSHQGGLVDDIGTLPAQTTDAALHDFVFQALPNRAYALAPPGLFFNYSNPNFSLVGLMTETLAGRPWADIANEDIFAPLGMTRTVARKSEVDPDNYALGMGITRPSDTAVRRVPLEELWEDGFVRPAGLVWSTPEDQMRLARFLVDGDPAVLSDALREHISTQHVVSSPDAPGGYGYGLSVGRGITLGSNYYPDVAVWAHGGNTLTHTSTFFVLPEQRFAISILSNGRGDDFTPSVVTAIATLVDLPATGEAPQPPFDPARLDALLGTYTDPNNVGRVIITRQGDRLYWKLPDVEAANIPYQEELTPISTHVWLANIQGQTLDLRFYEAPDHTFYMVNRAFVASRRVGINLTMRPIDTARLALDLTPSPALSEPWRK